MNKSIIVYTKNYIYMKLQDSNVRSHNVRHLQEKYWSVFRRGLLKITKVSVISFYSTPKNDLD